MERKPVRSRASSYEERHKSADVLGMKNYIIQAFDTGVKTNSKTRLAMQNALSAHLVNPWRTGEKDPALLAEEVVTAYTPFSHALVSIVEDAVNGGNTRIHLAQQVASWYVHAVDISADTNSAKKPRKEESQITAHPLGAVDALVEELPIQDSHRLDLVSLLRVTEQSSQAVDALFGLTADNEGSIMLAYIRPFLAGKLVRQYSTGASHNPTSPDAHPQNNDPAEGLMTQIEYIESERVKMGVDIEGHPTPRTLCYTPNPTNNALENLAVRATLLHAVSSIRSARPDAHCALYAMPNGETMIAAYRAPADRIELYPQVRRQLKDGMARGISLQTKEAETCLRFLFDPMEPDAQHARITELTDAFTASTQRVYSGGYRVEFGDDKDIRMGQMGFSHIQYTPVEGDVRVELGFGGSNVECVVHRDGRCTFPDSFVDPEARANVELIVKAHLVEAMREDTPAIQPSDVSTSQVEAIEKAENLSNGVGPADSKASHPVRQAAYLKGLPYGDRGQQRENEEVDREVRVWTTVPFSVMADAFLAAQLTPGFDPTRSETYRNVKEFKALPQEVQKKLDTVFARFPHKKSKSTVSGVVSTSPGYSVGIWPPRQVERRLLCELAYIPEVRKNVPDGPVSVSSARAIQYYHEILPASKPSAVEGIVYQR